MENANSEFALIQWNSQKDTFFKSLPDLRNSELHTDVLVSCEDSFYPAHRLILTLSSQYFARAFQLIPNGGYPVFILCGIKKGMLEAILSYIYEGKVTIVNKDVAAFMKTGRFLEIAGLIDIGNDNIPTVNEVSNDNVAAYTHEIINITAHIKPEMTSEDDNVEVVDHSPLGKQDEILNINQQETSTPHKIVQHSYNLHKEQRDDTQDTFITSNHITHENETVPFLNQPHISLTDVSSRYNSTLRNASEHLLHTDLASSTNHSQSYAQNILENPEPSFATVVTNIIECKTKISSSAVEVNDITKKRAVSKKHTRSCCRCNCCNKLFSTKSALSKHYSKMEVFNLNKRSLRSSNGQSDSDNISSNETKIKRTTDTQKLPLNRLNVENVKTTITAEESFMAGNIAKCKGKDTLTIPGDYCMPEKYPLPTFRVKSELKSTDMGYGSSKPSKRIKMDSSCGENELLTSKACSQPDDIHSNSIQPLEVDTDESPLFTISNVVSVPEKLALTILTNETSIITPSSALIDSTTLQQNENCSENAIYQKFEQMLEKSQDTCESDESIVAKCNYDASSCKKSFNRSIMCDICSSEYSSSHSFKKHKQTDCKILECPYCFHTYIPSEKDSLDEHMTIHSRQENPYTCPECPYQTDKARIMDDHIAIHEGIFKFWCPLCSFKGNSVKELQAHNQSHHPNVKVFD